MNLYLLVSDCVLFYIFWFYIINLISCLYINILVDNNKQRVAKRKREGDHTKEDDKKVRLEVKLEVKGKCGVIVIV